MTRETLKKANNYIIQIAELNRFVRTCRNCWKIIRLKHPKFKVITAYGALSDEIEVSEELAKRILITIEDYAHELEMDLEKM